MDRDQQKKESKLMDYQNITSTSSGKRIHGITCGTGPLPLHFLHANGFCAGAYLPLFEHFKDDFTVIATDIPGHGDSDNHGYKRIHHWDIFIDHVKDAIVSHTDRPIVGVGHSLGAVVTLLTAARHPGLFSRIVLIDPVIFTKSMLLFLSIAKKTGLMKYNPLAQGARRRKTSFTSKEEALERFSAGRGMFRTWKPEFIKAYCDHGLSWKSNGRGTLKCDPETEAQIYESVLLDIWNYPPDVTCPALLIRGEQSDTFTAKAAETLNRVIRDSKLVTVSGATHFVPMEKPAHVRKAIFDFCLE
jgi:pimeloyl-ACP methyl ester carboxylesterase